jgi:hypothetical protein
MLPNDGHHDFAFFAAGSITNAAPRGRGDLRAINGDKAEVRGVHG